jgi:hypothetical protein
MARSIVCGERGLCDGESVSKRGEFGIRRKEYDGGYDALSVSPRHRRQNKAHLATSNDER